MMKQLAADRRDNLIRVELGRGCYLLLTWGEYSRNREWQEGKAFVTHGAIGEAEAGQQTVERNG